MAVLSDAGSAAWNTQRIWPFVGMLGSRDRIFRFETSKFDRELTMEVDPRPRRSASPGGSAAWRSKKFLAGGWPKMPARNEARNEASII
jgi:hypothetical protein